MNKIFYELNVDTIRKKNQLNIYINNVKEWQLFQNIISVIARKKKFYSRLNYTSSKHQKLLRKTKLRLSFIS
jgi:hypothetical protein